MEQAANGRSWTVDVFGLSAAPVSVGGCTSPEYFEREIEHIFRRCWINVGREHEVPRPGSYLVLELEAEKTSIILLRGDDGHLRAFHNVCSHRCNRVLWADRGSCRALGCQFHGWTYDLDGKLIHVPDETQFFDFNRADHGLAPVAVETWQGFIFINLDARPSQDLRDYLGEIHDGLDGYPFDRLTRCYAWQLEIACNWKILKDAFSELYHVPFIHNVSAGNNFMEDNALPRALSFRLFPRGGQFSIMGNPEGSASFVGAIANKYGTTIRKRGEKLEQLPKLLNPAASDRWAGDIVQVFPSFQITLFPGFYLMLGFQPIAWNRCRWRFRVYYPEPARPSQRFSQEYAAAQLRDSILEDIRTLEFTQSVLSSRAKTHFNFSDQEVLVRANHLLTQKLAGPYPAVRGLQD
jgi:phenylpropionate dioxygenase-like ring-hydroxylating dioxygenase large terminal subunit